MSDITVKLSEYIVHAATARAPINFCSRSEQIERWARIGKFAEEHPDLPYEFIKSMVDTIEETSYGRVYF